MVHAGVQERVRRHAAARYASARRRQSARLLSITAIASLKCGAVIVLRDSILPPVEAPTHHHLPLVATVLQSMLIRLTASKPSPIAPLQGPLILFYLNHSRERGAAIEIARPPTQLQLLDELVELFHPV